MSLLNQNSFEANFTKTLRNLKEKFDSLRTEVPSPIEGNKPTIKEGVRQSVANTATEIYRLLITTNKKARRGSVALKTKICSLARVIRASERTVRRHIKKLIDLGLIQAKNRLGHGIQLVLNASLVHYKPADEAKQKKHSPPPQAPTIASADEPKYEGWLSDLHEKIAKNFYPPTS